MTVCNVCQHKETEKHVRNEKLCQGGLLPLAWLSFSCLMKVSRSLPSDVPFY